MRGNGEEGVQLAIKGTIELYEHPNIHYTLSRLTDREHEWMYRSMEKEGIGETINRFASKVIKWLTPVWNDMV